METKPAEETGGSSSQSAPEPTQESSRFKLRDLRPEKDPMGTSRKRRPKTGAERD
jgi:hypothetical protein